MHITVKVKIKAQASKVWEYWTREEHIKNWNFAASDWHCPNATNNLKIGGEFHYTMAAKDNSFFLFLWDLSKNLTGKSKTQKKCNKLDGR